MTNAGDTERELSTFLRRPITLRGAVVVIAVITAIFIAREQREHRATREAQSSRSDDAVHARFDALEERMGRIDASLSRSGGA